MSRSSLTRRPRGFTLTELMIVVAMIGVLSSLAVVGYRKYVESAKVSEPQSILQGIRSAEEEFRDKSLVYLDASASKTWYPRTNPNDSKKADWNASSHTDYLRWATLGVTVSGPVRFGYKVNAGAAGVAISSVAVSYKNDASTATIAQPSGAWYVAQAYGDPNEDGRYTA
ncbi:MAG: prepilin-type N-terminal cleavage/methylation domain-containing protein, partial [Myxococcales bacterium]